MKCRKCNKSFPNRGKLVSHIRAMHGWSTNNNFKSVRDSKEASEISQPQATIEEFYEDIKAQRDLLNSVMKLIEAKHPDL